MHSLASLIVLPVLATFIAACSSSRLVTVQVADGETGALIPDAWVHTYRHKHWPWWVWEVAESYRAPLGVARVRAIQDPFGIVGLVPEAPGYLPYWATSAHEDGTPNSYTRMTELKPWPFDEVTLTLYRKPEPLVELIIPDGYDGLVHVAMPVSCRPHMNGQRVFETSFQPGTVAVIPALPLDVLPIREARRASGESLLIRNNQHVRPDDVILRHVWSGHLPLPHVRSGKGENIWMVTPVRAEQYMEVYVVGTEQDQRRERAAIELRRPHTGPPAVAPAPPPHPLRKEHLQSYFAYDIRCRWTTTKSSPSSISDRSIRSSLRGACARRGCSANWSHPMSPLSS